MIPDLEAQAHRDAQLWAEGSANDGRVWAATRIGDMIAEAEASAINPEVRTGLRQALEIAERVGSRAVR